MIRRRVHQIWEAEHRPEGRDREHWEQAAREIDNEAGREESEASKEATGMRHGQRNGADASCQTPPPMSREAKVDVDGKLK